jgi:hypothetical protein
LRIGIVAFRVTVTVSYLVRLAHLHTIKARLDSPHRAEHTVACIVVKGISVTFWLTLPISHFSGCAERHTNTIHLFLSFRTHHTVSIVKVVLSIVALWVAGSISLVSREADLDALDT